MSKINTYIYVKSFTLIELAVSLIISGLVIGFTMSAFLIISKIMSMYIYKSTFYFLYSLFIKNLFK